MSEKGYKQDSQAKNKMLHGTIFVVMVELIIICSTVYQVYFQVKVCTVPLTKLGEGDQRGGVSVWKWYPP